MHKDITAPDLTKKEAIGRFVQESDILPWGGLISDEQKTKDEML
jgi:hypothetical protein